MGLQRTTHWATRELHDFLLARAETPFAWGTNDCCLFAADAIAAMTGVDIAVDFRGEDGEPAYTDEASALEMIRNVTGGESVADAAWWCAEKFEMPEWPYPLQAQRGDLVVVENGGRLIAGLVHLSGRHVVTMAESGIVKLPITAIKRAWSTSCGSRPLRGEGDSEQKVKSGDVSL